METLTLYTYYCFEGRIYRTKMETDTFEFIPNPKAIGIDNELFTRKLLHLIIFIRANHSDIA